MWQLDPTSLSASLSTTLLGHPLHTYASVTSTQDLVRTAARAGAPEGLAVAAGEQTAGKGRAARSWWSPPHGGLYVSLLLRPDLPPDHTAWVTMTLALGAADAIQQLCGLAVDIKWPNDLQWQGRKLAGVLAEGAFLGQQLDYVVAGIGLNVAIDFSNQPELAAIAVSLRELTPALPDPATLLAALLHHTERHYLALRAGHSPLPAWKARLHTLGRPVVAHGLDGRTLQGVAADVLPDGALLIELDDGRVEAVRASDVSLRTV
ncbi:MAG: biotin--[acetyl-CoA-carboxylase] ligase [Anaerolineae bacterium]